MHAAITMTGAFTSTAGVCSTTMATPSCPALCSSAATTLTAVRLNRSARQRISIPRNARALPARLNAIMEGDPVTSDVTTTFTSITPQAQRGPIR